MKPIKIAIIGAGLAGLACALECEKLGVTADVFERHSSIGWIWPSVSCWPAVVLRRYGNDPVKYLKDTYDINLKSITDERVYIIKSAKAEAIIEGKLGLSFVRGKSPDSLENQLLRELKKTSIHYNSLSNYKELSQKYDYVVVATGKEKEASDLGLWENQGRVSIMCTIALGSFDPYTTTMFFNTEYAGSGYARVSPFSGSEAIMALYVIDKGDYKKQQLDINRRFETFLEKENLHKLEMMYRVIEPPYSTGRVKSFRSGNVLLAGRSAGLADRTIGTGAVESIISGVLAARAIVNGDDYDKFMKPLQEHIENISVFRNHIENFSNDDFDKLIKLIGTAGSKKLIYNTNINFTDFSGRILRKLKI